MDLLEHLYTTHTIESAAKKSEEILDMAMSLDQQPYRGSQELLLEHLGKNHKYLVYKITSRKTVKIIYFIEESVKTVFVTGFFGTAMDDSLTAKRSI